MWKFSIDTMYETNVEQIRRARVHMTDCVPARSSVRETIATDNRNLNDERHNQHIPNFLKKSIQYSFYTESVTVIGYRPMNPWIVARA
jgi:hypothetical protein